MKNNKLPKTKEDELIDIGFGHFAKLWNLPDHRVAVLNLKDGKNMIWAETGNHSSVEDIKKVFIKSLLDNYVSK